MPRLTSVPTPEVVAAAGAPRSLRIVLGVTGGIAAFKAPLLLRLLTEAGHQVRVVPTRNALRFVGEATLAALSGQPVETEVFADAQGVDHVSLGQTADLVLVAPATADFLARAATGRADDLLGAVLLTARCPVVVAPAMHTEMWNHPATRANVATLRQREVHVIEPAEGRLTGKDSGKGRLPEPIDIVKAALAVVAPNGPLAGCRALVSAGGTREAIDPVRHLANASSGIQGTEIAAALARAGADVELVAANVADTVLATLPPQVRVTPVVSAADLRSAVRSHPADIVVMAAAVADFTPAAPQATKRKRTAAERAGQGEWVLTLVPTIDVLSELTSNPPLVQGHPTRPSLVVGFAAETGDEAGSVLEHGARKARSKGADLTVVNAVGGGRGFGDVDNEVWILDRTGQQVGHVRGSKGEVAAALVAAITSWRQGSDEKC
ncbi:bifunctional phosphopantothenoylcysteine decarboxylase/phosphopantothenate--cysteine ligase CoaBC [Buchananella hordeovulneris]|uniref:bifunctional phosphopantothenoylcysteine decarboxylase/phosphopantothenate--cysteine ligase CoaBC n=1 Tax=Buchananella hordeovulneris TaxID=52770 RepID=UPI001C9E21F7|nr:bifunctional phosphopantothenoylcysteine decarboxylase/phosphopantothenate--cysteine ligase CoaBC [Buchananella hordeovulneris]